MGDGLMDTQYIDVESIDIEGLSNERLEYLWNESQNDQWRMICKQMRASFEVTALKFGDVDFQSAARYIDPEKEKRADRIGKALGLWA